VEKAANQDHIQLIKKLISRIGIGSLATRTSNQQNRSNRRNRRKNQKMNKLALLIATIATIAISTSAIASPELARTKNCMSCHSVDRKLVGPSFQEISKRYKGTNAVQQMESKIINGGSGSWGPIPMPANKQVSEQEAQILSKWILSL
jgi:cytochrome c